MTGRRYGQRASNERGNPEDRARCIVEVWQGWYAYQCTRKRGHGEGGLYCKQHAKQHPAKEAGGE